MYEYNCKIVSIYDGDTLRADIDLGFGIWVANRSFRLARINAPELVKGNAAGAKSRQYLLSVCPPGTVMTARTYKDKAEKYGRMLADFYFENGICLNDQMVEHGVAKLWNGTGERPV